MSLKKREILGPGTRVLNAIEPPRFKLETSRVTATLNAANSPILELTSVNGGVKSQCYLKFESCNGTGSMFERQAAQIFQRTSASDLPIQLTGPPAAILAAAAAAARGGLSLEASIQGWAAENVISEIRLFGTTLTSTRKDAKEWPRLEGLTGLIDELRSDLNGDDPDLLIVPSDFEPWVEDLRALYADRGKHTEVVGIDWRPLRRTAFEVAARFARHAGRLIGLTGAAGLAHASELDCEGKRIVVLDCYSPKFFIEFARVPPDVREESKLGGLITPR